MLHRCQQTCLNVPLCQMPASLTLQHQAFPVLKQHRSYSALTWQNMHRLRQEDCVRDAQSSPQITSMETFCNEMLKHEHKTSRSREKMLLLLFELILVIQTVYISERKNLFAQKSICKSFFTGNMTSCLQRKLPPTGLKPQSRICLQGQREMSQGYYTVIKV